MKSKKEIILIGSQTACEDFFEKCKTIDNGVDFNNRLVFSNVKKFDFCCASIEYQSCEFIIKGLPKYETAAFCFGTELNLMIDYDVNNIFDAIIYLDIAPDFIEKVEKKRVIRNADSRKEFCIAIDLKATEATPLECLEQIDSLQKSIDKHAIQKIIQISAGNNLDTNCFFANYPKDVTSLICATLFYKNQSIFFSLPKDKAIDSAEITSQLTL
ncbi:MAG: hypothetical protein H0U70_01670 [Tatlockia sp.]|nr:hypothetical protein [Tatlockia sp.]